MDVGDLLHFEGTLQSDRIERAASDIKEVPGIFAGIDSSREIHEEYLFDCLVCVQENLFESAFRTGIDDLHKNSELGNKRFGSGNADLGSCTHKERGIGNPAGGTTKHIGYREGLAVMYACLPEATSVSAVSPDWVIPITRPSTGG